jgi:phosphoribosylanthranilate isomerase
MTRVKICGITTLEDALAAVEAGADAIGFIFAAGSPRTVTPEHAAQIAAGLPPFVWTVGVFVDQPAADLLRIATQVPLQAVQLHGKETDDYSRQIPLPIVKAIRVRNVESLSPIGVFPARAFLLDAYVEGQPGGTGMCAPWELAAQVTGKAPIILSGGLRPENVADAIRRVHPFGVDVSSGVERAPGRKDHRKVKEFIAHVRETDRH